MTSNLDVTVAVNMDSGTIDVTPFAEPTRDHVQAVAAGARRNSPAGDGGVTIHPQVPRGLPSSQIFGTFRRWPLVPSAELYRLQSALTQCVELAGYEAAHDLLGLVTAELQQRSAEEPAEIGRLSGQARAPRNSANDS